MPVGNAFDHALWMAHLTFTAPLSMMAACLLFGVHVRYRYVACGSGAWGWSVASGRLDLRYTLRTCELMLA